MDYPVDDEFKSICQTILNERKCVAEWAEIESDDMFQTQKYEGGFDADEGEFCFSLHGSGQEFWFQVSLEQVRKITQGEVTTLDIRPAET